MQLEAAFAECCPVVSTPLARRVNTHCGRASRKTTGLRTQQSSSAFLEGRTISFLLSVSWSGVGSKQWIFWARGDSSHSQTFTSWVRMTSAALGPTPMGVLDKCKEVGDDPPTKAYDPTVWKKLKDKNKNQISWRQKIRVINNWWEKQCCWIMADRSAPGGGVSILVPLWPPPQWGPPQPMRLTCLICTMGSESHLTVQLVLKTKNNVKKHLADYLVLNEQLLLYYYYSRLDF